MKYDLTSDLIFFRPVMKVKYINNCKEIFDFKHMGLFIICQGVWSFGGWEILSAKRGVIGSQRSGSIFLVSVFCWNYFKVHNISRIPRRKSYVHIFLNWYCFCIAQIWAYCRSAVTFAILRIGIGHFSARFIWVCLSF